MNFLFLKLYVYFLPFCTGKFLLYLIEGLTYPDESIKSSVVYILVQLCTKRTDCPLPLNIVHELCRNVPPCLTMARSAELTVNLMGK